MSPIRTRCPASSNWLTSTVPMNPLPPMTVIVRVPLLEVDLEFMASAHHDSNVFLDDTIPGESLLVQIAPASATCREILGRLRHISENQLELFRIGRIPPALGF